MRRVRIRIASVATLVCWGCLASLPGAAEAPNAASRSLTERVWFGDTGQAHRAEQTRLMALQVGVENVEPASRALLADTGTSDPLPVALMAVRLAPDLPASHMALARVYWGEGEHRLAAAEVTRGLAAIPRHLEATFWVAGTLLTFSSVVLVLGSLAFIVLVSVSLLSHASHDLGDLFDRRMPGFARASLLGSLVLVPLLMGEGILGLTLVFVALGFAYGTPQHRVALGLAAALIVIGMYPIARTAGMALTALDADPVASAAFSVSRGMGTPAELALLKDAAEDNSTAQLVLALDARRSGDLEAALVQYQDLHRKLPRDEVVLTNLANLHFHNGDLTGAMDLYQRSAGVVDSATLQFNLSQAYAKSFHIQEFEHALQRAQEIDADLVAELSRIKDPDVVADLGFPVERIRERMIAAADGRSFADELRTPFGAGRLADGWTSLSAGFALAAVLGLLVGSRYEHSSRCRRCGQRVCGRCDGTVWNSETCEACYTLYHRPETTDSGLRTARLNQLRARDARLDKIASAASLLLPGAAGLLARRPDLGFVAILLFTWAALSFFWRGGVVPDPMAVGSAGPLAFLITGAIAAFGYFLVVAVCWLIRRSQ